MFIRYSIGVREAEFSQNPPLEGFHALRLFSRIVLETAAVQYAVDYEVRPVSLRRFTLLPGLAFDGTFEALPLDTAGTHPDITAGEP